MKIIITLKKLVKAFIPYGFLYIFRKIKNKKNEKAVKLLGLREEIINFNFTLFDGNKPNTYGQCGEDLLLRLFMDKPVSHKGFYVDIGAFHPAAYSNTKYFYDIGWHGINIDANPSSIKEFEKYRGRDINLSCGVSDEYGNLDYYYFGEQSTINSFDREQAYAFEKEHNVKIMDIKKIPVQPINAILDKYCPTGQHIDFVTLDVEGFEMRILKSFNFAKYAPDYFLVEDLDCRNKNIAVFKETALYQFLKSKGYEVIGKTHLTYMFKGIVSSEYITANRQGL